MASGPDPPPDPAQPPDLADRAMNRRRREDAAFALPVLGVLLLASPVIDIFAGPFALFGLPLSFLYVFAVWAGLILVTRSLARRLMRHGGWG